MITTGAKDLVLSKVVEVSINNIQMLAVSNQSGEVFRKQPQSVDIVTASETKYTFYLTEDEANTVIVKLSLVGDGATTVLNSGLTMATQTVNIDKTNTQSLLLSWTVKTN